jgi:hypothetical protein
VNSATDYPDIHTAKATLSTELPSNSDSSDDRPRAKFVEPDRYVPKEGEKDDQNRLGFTRP